MRTLATLVLLGSGLVLLPAPAGAAVPSCDGVRATIMGTDRADVIRGTAHRDVIVAGRGDDTVDGRGGNDVICGGFGADRLEGGPGRDRLYGEGDAINDEGAEGCLHGDALDGGRGDDLLDPGGDSRHHLYTCDWNQVRFRHGSGHGVYVDLETGNAVGQGRDTIVHDTALEVVGSDRNDRIYGTDAPELVDARGGKDAVHAGGGNDRVIEGKAANGDDLYDMGDGEDTVITFRGHDTVLAGADRDELILTNPGWMAVEAGPGDDAISRYAVRAGGSVDGGDGADLLNVLLLSQPGDQVRIDVPASELALDDQVETASGIESWNVVSIVPLLFTGGDGDDTVIARGYGDATTDDVADGGAGTDYADLTGGDDVCTNIEDGPC